MFVHHIKYSSETWGFEEKMLVGATTSAIDMIRRGFPEGVTALQSDYVLAFRLGRDAGAMRYSLGLGAIEKEHVQGAPKLEIEELEIYFDVPEKYANEWRGSILHFNAWTNEFELLKIVLAKS